MRRFAWLIALALAACSSPTVTDGNGLGSEGEFAPPDPSSKADSAAATGGKGQVFRLQIDHGAFPAIPGTAFPNVLVYLPATFDPTPPVNVVVFLHGFYNCIDNVIMSRSTSCDAQRHTPGRYAYNLAAQFDAANKNAVLIIPELARDQASSDPGTLTTQDGFAALVNDTFAKVPALANLTSDDIAQLQVITHSGGYKAAAGIANYGGVAVSDLVLLDSLYGVEDEFDAWVNYWPNAFLLPRDRRLSIVYSAAAGTLADSQAMATRTKALWPDPADDVNSFFVDDRTTNTLPDSSFGKSLIFKRTGMIHDPLVLYYFGKLVATSDLPSITATAGR